MIKQLQISAFLFLLATLLPAESWGQQTAETAGITNFSLVEDSAGFGGPVVGFGGATDPSSMHWLKESGFRTVINLRRSSEAGAYVDSSAAAAEALDLRYFHLPVDADTVDWDLIEAFIDEVGDQHNQPVYIHCGSATRAAALWMVARVVQDGWPIELAAEEARTIAGKPERAIEIAQAYLNARTAPSRNDEQ